jgi:indolepyruvate decarboxylase
MPTVIEYVLNRLSDLGVSDVFGVPGDYSFGVSDAIVAHPGISWIGCSNELNASYAADGYARIVGVGALSTTFGVGELSAINGIAGSFAEHLPVFHLVGMPDTGTQRRRALMHHTLGAGDYDVYARMTEPVVAGLAILTPENAVAETERLISQALYHRRPVYLGFPADLINKPVLSDGFTIPPASSDPASLSAAASAILEALDAAETAVALPGILVQRSGAAAALESFIDASNLPFATMFMAKSVLDEQHPRFVGMYDGAIMNAPVKEFVESRDLVIDIASPFSDFNSGAFTSHIDPARLVSIGHHHVEAAGRVYPNVELGDVLEALASATARKDWEYSAPAARPAPKGAGDDPLTVDGLYPRWEQFLRPNDVVVAETGTVSMGLGFAHLPKGAAFHNQTLWGSIGWATPAAFGVAVAATNRRVLLFTGDGSHQLTAQEIAQFGRNGLKPIVFVLNNDGYLIERLLCKEPAIEYNDIARWNYSLLPAALGCDDWFTARVTTCGELDDALAMAATVETGAYIEVVTDAYAASPLAEKLGESLKALRKGQ